MPTDAASATASKPRARPPVATPAEIRDAAHRFGRLGYGVFTLKPGAKVPATAHGLKDATTDPEAIARAFRNGANLGLLPPAHVLVLDVDDPEQLPALLDTFPELEQAPRHATPRGGAHLFVRLPKGYKIPARTKAAAGLDLRGMGRAYLVAPPSTVDGSPYTVVRPLVAPDELPEASRELLEYVSPAKPARVSQKAPQRPTATAGHGYGAAALTDEARKVRETPEGGRNDALNAAAFNLGQLIAGGELDRAEVEAELEAAAREVGLGTQEAQRTIASGITAGMQHPRTAPERPAAPAPQHQFGKAPAPRVTVTEPPLPAAPDLAMIHFRLSDLGNAERFAHRHGDHVRHVEGLGWHYFDGRRWALDTSGHVQRLAAKTIRELYGLLEYVQDTKEREQLFKHAMRSESGKALDLMLEKARAGQSHRILNARADQLDADPDLLNVLNGTIHLPSGELRPHNPADLITKLAPVEYHPDAAAPTWEAFQRRISGDDDELIAFKRRAYGYTATGHTREQVLMIAFGTGANGKTTELEAIAARLGDYAATAAFDTFAGSRDAKSQRFGLARLPGARFVRASEGDDGVRLSEGTVKAVTGDEVIVAEHKMRAPFEYRPRFALWLSSNHKPVTRGTDHGLWRRIRLVPYPVTIPDAERDHRLLEKLAAEAPGILAWIVAGAREWYAHGLGTAAAVEAATDEYRAEMDRLAAFLAVGIEANTIHSTASSELHAAYRGWCKDNGERPMTQSSFTQAMLERGHEKKRTGPGVVWIGLHLTPEGRQWAEKARQDGNRIQ